MSLIIAGYAKDLKLRQTPDQKTVCDFIFCFSQRTGQTTLIREIPASAWNLVAESLMNSYPEGGYVILDSLYRDDVVEREGGVREHYYNLSVNRVYPGSEGLNLNYINLVGSMAADPELKYFDSGSVKATGRLGVRRVQNTTDWINIESWSNIATTMSSYATKGRQIAIEGSFRIDSWTDKTTGQERFKPFVVIDRLTLLGSNRSEQSAETAEALDSTDSSSSGSASVSATAPTAPSKSTRKSKASEPQQNFDKIPF